MLLFGLLCLLRLFGLLWLLLLWLLRLLILLLGLLLTQLLWLLWLPWLLRLSPKPHGQCGGCRRVVALLLAGAGVGLHVGRQRQSLLQRLEVHQLRLVLLLACLCP